MDADSVAVDPRHDVNDYFWSECDKGVLWLQRCRKCEQWQHYPRELCSHCWSDDIVWQRPSGLGRVRSFSIVERGSGAFAALAPYVVALVRFDEGPTMMTNIIGDVSPDVGSRVRLTFDDRTGRNLPVFTVDTTDD